MGISGRHWSKKIYCRTNGQTYANARECAKALDVGVATVYRHLDSKHVRRTNGMMLLLEWIDD